MNPRRALLICYYFPPLGMGGIGRPLNLFQELPKLGWDCHVLTVKGVAYRGYEPELSAGLDQTRIHRSGSYDPQRLLYLLGVRQVRAATIAHARAVSSRFFPDSKAGWAGPAVRLGRKLLERESFDVIVSTSPPVSCHLIGRQLSRESGIPWVADFRDYWTIEPVEKSYDNESFIERGNRLLGDIRTQASALTTVNESIRDYLGRGEVIRNAFNESLARLWAVPAHSTHFRIGLLGHQFDEPIWELLLDTLLMARNINAEADARIELIQIGQIDQAALMRDIAARSLRCKVVLLGQLSRTETITALNDTHLIYLGMPQRLDFHLIPGRVYDMLPSGRAILCTAPPYGEVAGIIEPTGNGRCFNQWLLVDAAAFLYERVHKFTGGSLTITPNPTYAEPFGSGVQARKFADLFERIV